MSDQEKAPVCSVCGETEQVTEYVRRDDPAQAAYLCDDCYWSGYDPLFSIDMARD